MPFGHDFSLSLAAASSIGICATQIVTASVAMTIAGGFATGGVATFDVPRRVQISSAANESANTFTIVGTDYYGRPQTEALLGGSATTVYTARDFLTVSKITPSTTGSGNIAVGSNTIGSTIPWVVDQFANPSVFGIGAVVTGQATFNIELAEDNLAPAWDVNTNVPTWYAQTPFNSAGATGNGIIQGPLTMLRLTIVNGTGSVVARARQSYIAGRA